MVPAIEVVEMYYMIPFERRILYKYGDTQNDDPFADQEVHF